jgi:hypothetical protein
MIRSFYILNLTGKITGTFPESDRTIFFKNPQFLSTDFFSRFLIADVAITMACKIQIR